MTRQISSMHISTLLVILAVASIAVAFGAGFTPAIADSDVALTVSCFGLMNAVVCALMMVFVEVSR